MNDLLKQRYKVIADYPGNSEFEIGDIINQEEIELIPKTDTLDNYPHLFKKLAWWEDRQESEMPEFVSYVSQSTNKKIVDKVSKWKWFSKYSLEAPEWHYQIKDVFWMDLCQSSLPATQQDYLNQSKL